jgi:hypothetical protein
MRQPKTTGRRKRAAPRRKTTQQLERFDASGLTPLDYALSVMRDPKATPARRDEMAKMAAAYVHPQLAPMAADVTRVVATLLTEIFEKLKS